MREIYKKQGYLATESRVVIGEFFELESGILPGQAHQLDREIIVKRGAKVLGDIVGGLVFLGQGVEIMGSVICENITVDNNAKVWGGIYSSGQVLIGSDINIERDIVGDIVDIGPRGVVNGHVYGLKLINLGSDCQVKGIVYSDGDVKIGEYSRLHDLLARDHITIEDAVIIEDNTIWSVQGTITFGCGVIIGEEGEGSLLKDGLRAYRREGVEFNQSFSDSYHYVHSIDTDLNDITESKYNELLEEVTKLPAIELPIKDDGWKTRTLDNTIDFVKLEETITSAWYGQTFPSLWSDLKSMITSLSQRVESILESGDYTEEGSGAEDDPREDPDTEDTEEGSA